MPHRSHHRRHRTAPRAVSVVRDVALWTILAAGTIFLVAFLLQSRAGATAIVLTGAGCALFALAALSLAAGRFAALVRNGFSVYSAHVDLGRFMRTNAAFRAARNSVERPRF